LIVSEPGDVPSLDRRSSSLEKETGENAVGISCVRTKLDIFCPGLLERYPWRTFVTPFPG
jgi:hypothetical protein